MRSLLFADWCALRENILRYVLATLLACLLMTVAGASDAASATELYAQTQLGVASLLCAMVTMMGFFGLFGADERVGWEAVRLSLPVSRRDVVRARMTILLLLLVASAAASLLLGSLVAALVTWIGFGAPLFALTTDAALMAAGFVLFVSLYAAIEMPLFFWKGASKARVAFSLPLLLIPLLTLDPVRSSLAGIESWINALPSPWLLLGIAAPVVAVALAASCLASEHLYARRDF